MTLTINVTVCRQMMLLQIGQWHMRVDFPYKANVCWIPPSFQMGWRCEFFYTGWCFQIGFWYVNWTRNFRFDYIE